MQVFFSVFFVYTFFMKLIGITTSIFQQGENIYSFFIEHIKKKRIEIKENSIVVISSKIVALSQNRVSSEKLRTMVEKEADEILVDKGEFFLTVKNGIVIANAGIDQSNSKQGEIILWPEQCQNFVDEFRKKLQELYQIKNIGVVLSDSRVTMRRRGTVGVALAWSGFWGVKDERGKKDLFGRVLEVSTVNIADNMVSASEILMGQADECTPFVLIENINKNLFTNIQQHEKNAWIGKKEDLFFVG